MPSTQPVAAGSISAELSSKLAAVRDALERHRLGAVRLRSHGWFAWATCGGSNAVLLAAEVGVAEVLVTPTEARVVTDAIEAERIRDEELPATLEVVGFPWARPAEREDYVREAAQGRDIASDLPADGEQALPAALVAERRRLRGEEIERYRLLARDAAEALTETLETAIPSASELEVAAIGAGALLRRGIDPALVLVGGAARAERYRHPRPTEAVIGDRVSVVFCARRWGLYANLTRHAFFRRPTKVELANARAVATVEAAALEASLPGATLGQVYDAIADGYVRAGHAGAELGHHQGGITAYLSREALAMPGSLVQIRPPVALAWNPSLPGSKIEDTLLRTTEGLEVLTVDPAWPTVEVAGRLRPDLRVLG
jgi:Xaa-Pro aminopeptidase